MVNKVILVGNLGRDPEVRSTPSGQQVATFSLATNRRWTGRDGERREETEWHNIEVWGRLAEVAGQYVRKGTKLYVEGRIKTDSWDDRETGAKRYKTKVVCENFQMLSGRGETESGAGGSYGGGGGGGGGGGAPMGPQDDDIPF